MRNLSEEEIAKLSRIERYTYYDELRQNDWSSKSLKEKEIQVLNDISFFIGKRGISDLTLEEEIEIAITNKNDNHNYIGSLKSVIKNYQKIQKKGELFTFFWETKSPFSQWHKSDFQGTTFLIEGFDDSYDIKRKELLDELFPFDVQNYSSAEQFMMYHKAMIFFDREIALKVMKTQNVREIKNLGRKVKNFNEEIWRFYRSKIVYEGNKAKFTQNEDLKQALLSTKRTTLVEAAPNDKLWGIGLAENDTRAQKRETWQGKNLLGEILTKIRIDITEEY